MATLKKSERVLGYALSVCVLASAALELFVF